MMTNRIQEGISKVIKQLRLRGNSREKWVLMNNCTNPTYLNWKKAQKLMKI